MLKKFFLVIFLLSFVSACSDEEGTGNSGLSVKEMSHFSVAIPDSWEVVENESDALPKPGKGNIELVASSTTVRNGFKNNILILSDSLNTFTTSKEFSILNNVGASREYIDYLALSTDTITFADEEESIMYVFEAKYNLDTPKLKFLQTARVCDQNKGFLLTIAIPSSMKDITRYQDILSSFTCKQKTE